VDGGGALAATLLLARRAQVQVQVQVQSEKFVKNGVRVHFNISESAL